ncbi:hypothetical protein BMG_6352 (plasmid) [Priestia megaterium]|uniref:hypothetical protein n=1 Tax=Priestia megaterium TaxID=1404 RepID=UPI0015DCA5E2|nr:hypothetical protein [Priestia megaterium]QLK09576.1 hypothetical protein BMG_6352 [Priestia megaterium]
MEALHWQPEDRSAIFPSVILITPVRYAVHSEHIRIIQVASIHELMEKYKGSAKQQRDGKPRESASSGGIKLTSLNDKDTKKLSRQIMPG